MSSPEIILVGGPTASGKSALALRIAQESDGVIINADSQQAYAHLRILTARPTPVEEALIPHRLYGFLKGDTACSAGIWLKYARMEIDWVLAQGKTPVIVGGTGLYLKALVEGLAEIPDIPQSVRSQAENDLAAMGNPAFHERLCAVDPVLGARLKPGDSQRLTRAWAVWLGTGKPLSWWQSQGNRRPYPEARFRFHRLMPARDELYAACNARFDAMMAAGALEEVRELLSLGLPESCPVMKIIGVPELAAYLRKEISLESAADKAKQATRNYAKRQLTWFRHQLPDHLFLKISS